MEMGSRNAAYADMNAAHAREPSSADILSHSAMVKMAFGDLGGALTDFDAAEQLAPLPSIFLMGRDAVKAGLSRQRK